MWWLGPIQCLAGFPAKLDQSLVICAELTGDGTGLISTSALGCDAALLGKHAYGIPTCCHTGFRTAMPPRSCQQYGLEHQNQTAGDE